uniref:Uncharacterized protein n=1 Tax=Meloidogyne incognita TaxID=6306 RepID=A0A914MVE6_MELIC
MEKIYLIPFQVPPTSSIGLDYPVKPFYRHWLIDSGPLPTPTFSIGTGYPLSDPSPQPTQYL